MAGSPRQISIAQWDVRYRELCEAGLVRADETPPLRRYLDDGNRRLDRLRFDDSPAALRLWDFLLSEEARLRQARAAGEKLVGVMKDLGTTAVLAFAAPGVRAFYPDGAWWLPCLMEQSTHLLEVADSLGIDDSFCPVRAMLGAFVRGCHFPIPDLLVCSVGATCDDFSVIAQRLAHLGHEVLWWEMPHRRRPDEGEEACLLPGGLAAPRSLVDFVRGQLDLVRRSVERLTGAPLTEPLLREGIARANHVRRTLAELRRLAYSAPACPMGALEMLVAEMLAIHFCSDPARCAAVLADLLAEVRQRVLQGQAVLPPASAMVFWVNPVADLAAMNLLEECGGRVCGTDYMFCHALDEIPEGIEPLDALAQMALADPMVGSAADRAQRICREACASGAEAIVISRIPGASHCATEGAIIRQVAQSPSRAGPRPPLPVLEIEVPPLTDGVALSLRTRLEALVETCRARR